MENTNGIQSSQSTGYLIVKVSTARGAIPLEGAAVGIRGGDEESSGIVYSLTTDRDGLVQRVALPTPDASLSETPGSAFPYSLWNIDVFKDGYLPISFQNVPVYAGIVSVQPAVMIPMSQNYTQKQIYRESQNPDL